MASNNILIVSTTPFFGGGETFICSVLSKLEHMYFIVRDTTLQNRLNPETTLNFNTDSFWEQLKQVRQSIKKFKIQIVLLNGGSAMYMAPFLTGVSVVLYRHTTNKSVGGFFKQLTYKSLLHLCYAFSDKIIHVSQFSANEQKLFRKKAVIILNGISQPVRMAIEINPDAPIKILFLGRIDASKGIVSIIKAVQQFGPEQVQLDVVGSGALSNWVEQQSDKHIIYHGFQQNVAPYYQRADLYIMLSEFENCPFTIIEAMAWSKPVIATSVGGIPELVIDQENGILIQPIETQILDAITKLAENRQLLISMGERSRELFEQKLTLEHCIRRVKQVLDQL